MSVERDVSEPALDDIRNIAALFSLPVSFFFSDGADSDEAAYIVRSGTRRVMTDTPKGLAESLLSPDLGGAFEIIHSVFAPGAACPEPFVRPTEEAGYVLEGRLVLFIDGVRFELNSGDSFRFAGEQITWVLLAVHLEEGELPVSQSLLDPQLLHVQVADLPKTLP